MFWVFFGVWVALRLYAAAFGVAGFDVLQYKNWAVGAATNGISSAYETTAIDYPPLFLYMLTPLGKLYLWTDPLTHGSAVQDSRLLTFLVKLPSLLFDGLLALLLLRFVPRLRLWGAAKSGAAWGRIAALLFLWNPAVLMGSARWGQPDGIHGFLAVASLVLLTMNRPGFAGGSLAAAALMKPLAAPLVPLLACGAALRRGGRGLFAAGIGGLIVGALVFSPFILGGRLFAVLRRVVGDLDAMPYASVNAHNLWWILAPWTHADAAWLGPLSPRVLGLTLFLIAYAALLLRWCRAVGPGSPGHLFELALAVTASFFFLVTHMHENHLLLSVPLSLAVAGRSRALGWIAVGFSVAAFTNMFLHDTELPHRLPGLLSRASDYWDPVLKRPYTWLQFIGAFANTLLVAMLTWKTYRLAWHGQRGLFHDAPR